MSLSMHSASIPVFQRVLGNLKHVLAKGAEFADSKKIDPATLPATRLIADMLPLTKQVQIACDMAARGAARLAGVEPKKFEDNETTLAELQARVQAASDYIGTFTAAQIDGSESRTVTVPMRGTEAQMDGQTYLLHFVLPNLYFHVTTAYDILRANGVPLGKADFLGEMPKG